MYVADERAVTESSNPLLVVRVGSAVDVPFRCRADLLYGVDANLSLANLDWDDFRDNIDASGIWGGSEPGHEVTSGADANPSLAAYRSGADEPLTLALPFQPVNFWGRICNELRETGMTSSGEVGLREVVAIAGMIADYDEPAVVNPEDHAVITLSHREWAFVHARLKQLARNRQLESRVDLYDDDGRPDGLLALKILGLLSRHL